MSRRTLFRLFATKEDIVVAAFDNLGDEASAALREGPVEEAPWTALRHALGAAVSKLEERPGRPHARRTQQARVRAAGRRGPLCIRRGN